MGQRRCDDFWIVLMRLVYTDNASKSLCCADLILEIVYGFEQEVALIDRVIYFLAPFQYKRVSFRCKGRRC